MIPEFTPHDTNADRLAALKTEGCLVIKGMTDEPTRQGLIQDMEDHLAQAQVDTEVDPEEFYPGHTRRVTALIARSTTARDLAMHPLIHDLLSGFLLPNCERYQLHVSSALCVGPGARKQVLHREDDVYPFFPLPRPDTIVASMWAMTDFTAANGATQIVPGSHRWEAGREAEPGEVIQAEMAAGDVLLWNGGILHGAGANTTSEWRYGVFLSFSLGWLRQEENQFLDVPPHIAETLPKPLRELLGYKMHDGLGFYDPNVAKET